MSRGPPYETDEPSTPSLDWESISPELDFPDRDIRLLPGWGAMVRELPDKIQEFGDFDPQPDDPDPDVWPLEDYDPGYPADLDDLILITSSAPAPHVAWVTREYLKALKGYDPTRQTIDIEELPPWHRPDTPTRDGTIDVVATNDAIRSMDLTPDRKTALTRLANLWNGELVRGHHLLRDKLPSWMDIFGDLDQTELKRLVVDPEHDYEIARAFGDHAWYRRSASVYTAPKSILRKKVWYSPTLKGKTLINQHSDLPSLRGDLNEGLPHRVAVGLAAVRERHRGRVVETYRDIGEYTVDIASQDDDRVIYVGEVMTDHHNWQLHRDTYKKLDRLHQEGMQPYVVFDSRATAYRVFNHWHNHESLNAELPKGAFDSDPNITTGQSRIEDAYERANWSIPNWTTTSALWNDTLGDADTTIDTDNILSKNW